MRKHKKAYTLIAIVIVGFGFINLKSIIYGLQQGAGQAEVLWNAKKIEGLLTDSTFPDSTKDKFKYIAEVKAFSEQFLGLNQTQNYSTFYDQKGKPILWVVTASPEFEIKAYEWSFPIAGSFPYKGSFDLEIAKEIQAEMNFKGFDTELDEVNAWSTLGWFKDPILSSMLQRGSGSLAELIIHESTHATLYVKDSAAFNENLASFVGKLGAEKFLAYKFGEESKELRDYKNSRIRRNVYKDYLRKEINVLNGFYGKIDTTQTIEKRRAMKLQQIEKIREGLFEINFFSDSLKGRVWLDKLEFNNAYFSGFSTYSSDLPKLGKQLQKEFNGDLKEMVTSFKGRYESL
ncbi:MAG: aminopeptidase [Vicingaceae bacterium]|jgi:predicted aminopeptidase